MHILSSAPGSTVLSCQLPFSILCFSLSCSVPLKLDPCGLHHLGSLLPIFPGVQPMGSPGRGGGQRRKLQLGSIPSLCPDGYILTAHVVISFFFSLAPSSLMVRLMAF